MKRGIVKFFNEKKGWGFIIDSETKKEFYVHFTSIKGEGYKSLNVDDEVEFEIGEGQKGPQALNVVKK